jgi:hypothetical protein
MATVFECTTEEQRSVVRFFFCGQKDSLQRISIKKYFLFTVESVCRVKRFTIGSVNSLKDVRKSHMMPNQVRKWLRQQSKGLYAAGFDALVKRWDKCISVGGGLCREINVFVSRFEYHMFYVLYPFVTYLLILPCTWARPVKQPAYESRRYTHMSEILFGTAEDFSKISNTRRARDSV